MSIRRCSDCEHPYGHRAAAKKPCSCTCHWADLGNAIFVEDWEGLAQNPRDAVELYLRDYSRFGYVANAAAGLRPYKPARRSS